MRGIRAIKSRATSKSRFRLGQVPTPIGVPPIMLDPPQILLGAYSLWSYTQEVIYVNTNILVIPGLWDETDGVTDIQFRIGVYPPTAVQNTDADFYEGTAAEYDDIPGVRSFAITEAMAGKFIQLHVIATRGGVVFDDYFGYNTISGDVPAPQIGGFSALAPRFVRPDLPIGKPNYAWTAGATITPITIVGEWYRNEVATGVTGELFPDPDAVNPLGRVTVEGDLVRWQETCTNAASVSGTSPVQSGYQTLVSDLVPDTRDHLRSQIPARITGLPGGATSMDVYNPVVHNVDVAASNYVFNENNWCADLRYQLSAHCVGQRFRPPLYNGFSARYGFFLITPRHILSCAHIGAITDQRYVRFLTHDDRIIEARCQTSAVSPELTVNVFDALGGFDLQIILLDKDMAAEGLHAAPILGLTHDQQARLLINQPGDIVPILGVSQDGLFGGTVGAFAGAGNPLADYTAAHHRMLYIGTGRSWFPGFDLYPDEYNGYHYAPYKGDSGGPTMVLAHGKFFINGVHYDGNMNANPVGSGVNRAALTNLIELAETKAIAQGFLDAPTGLLPTFVELEDIASYPVPVPQEPHLLLLSEADPVALRVSEADPTFLVHPYYS